MIQFSHIYKTYPGPVHALRDVSLNIKKGEFLFLKGPSGAGKSTLFRLLSAFERPTSGRLAVMKYNLTSIKDSEVPYFRRQIGVVYQDFKLLDNRTIFENIAIPLEVRGDRQKHIKKRVQEVLDQVGLIHRQNHHPSQLSGGEQQRVSIARALVHQPGILIADEPTGNLDPELSEEIMALFDKVNAQGTTVFVATHNHEVIKRRSKKCLHIQEGKLESP